MILEAPNSRTLVFIENAEDAAHSITTDLVGKAPIFVSFDWLTLDSLRKAGHQVYPVEDFIPRDVGIKYQEMLEDRVRNWHFFRGEDLTEFEGISLGAAFKLELSNYFAYAMRYGLAFARAFYQLEPDHLIAYLVPDDHPYLEYAIKREVIHRVAETGGVSLELYESTGPEQIKKLPEMICRDIYRLDPDKRIFFWLLSAIQMVLEKFRGKKPEILICSEGIFYNPLFERYLERKNNLGYRMIFPVVSRPVRSLIMTMIRNGSVPFYPRGMGRKKCVGKPIRGMRRRLRELMVKPEWMRRWELEGIDFSSVFRRIIHEVVLADIEATAEYAVNCRRELDRRPIKAAVFPNDKARAIRILLEAAKRQGIETFYYEHGVNLYRLPQSFDSGRKLTDHIICWGKKDRQAYRSLGANEGNLVEYTPPFLSRYLPMKKCSLKRIRKVLLLQHCYTKDHINGIAHSEEEFMIKICKGLRKMGLREIRLKVHPGMSMKAYFQSIVNRYQLNLEVYKDEDLRELILWSDLVIGPISTAALEVLLLGREYYCVDLEGLQWERDSAFDGDRLRIYPSVEEALSAIRLRNGSPWRDDFIRSVCNIGMDTTRDEVLDPLIDFFAERYALNAVRQWPGVEALR
jgi:hypothetical protein